MQIDELQQIVATLRTVGGDYNDVEAKASKTALPSSVKDTLSAFSNSDGGVIILGLAETEGFAATGVDDPVKIATDLTSVCANEFEPPLRPLVTQHQLEGKNLVVVEVPELPVAQKPAYIKARGMANGSFVRVNDADQRMSPYEVQMLLANRGQPVEDTEPVPGSRVSDLDPAMVNSYLDRVRASRTRATEGLDDIGVLKQSRVVVSGAEGQDTLSLGGLLALGRLPQAFVPQLNLTVVVYPTNQGPEADGVRFLDNVTLDGPIPVIAKDALAALRRNMRRRSTVSGIGRTDTWEYPEAALREAIVNSLVHRDLSAASRGTQVQIEMYPDRLEIKNPGGLFGPVSVADLTGGAGQSSARNAFLLRLLEDVAIPGEDQAICENRGSGIRTMVNALRDAGMSVPRFADRAASFTVTFPNHTLMDDDTVVWLGSLGERDLTDSQYQALAMLKLGERLDNSKYRAATGVDSRVATNELQDLVTRELVIQVGSRRWTEYRIAPRLLDEESPGDRRLAPRDRRPIILDALGTDQLSRAEIERRTGLNRQVVIRWLRTLRAERLIRTVGDVSPQNSRVKYERTPQSWGQETLNIDID